MKKLLLALTLVAGVLIVEPFAQDYYKSFSFTVGGGSGTLSLGGTVGGINLGPAGFIGQLSPNGGYLYFPADGTFRFDNFASSRGVILKVEGLPTVSGCGAGTPAVGATSSPMLGTVTVGTGGPTACIITFNGTAYPQNAICSSNVVTTTPANTRAIGASATTTALTITPASAFVDSSVVNWNCWSSR